MHESLHNLPSNATSVARLGRGSRAGTQDVCQPEVSVELYEYEVCPYCRKVRDALCELDLEYICHPCVRGSRNRETLRVRGGKVQVPYLVDPNTGVELYESDDIIAYLRLTYGAGRSGSESPRSSEVASAAHHNDSKAATSSPAPSREILVLFSDEASLACRKVREALGRHDLDYHVKRVAKHPAHQSEPIEPSAETMAPYLVDPNTGTELADCEAIVDYLDATYGEGA